MCVPTFKVQSTIVRKDRESRDGYTADLRSYESCFHCIATNTVGERDIHRAFIRLHRMLTDYAAHRSRR